MTVRITLAGRVFHSIGLANVISPSGGLIDGAAKNGMDVHVSERRHGEVGDDLPVAVLTRTRVLTCFLC